MRVTFCGHGEISKTNELKLWLSSICEELIKNGAQTFYLGNYGDFDKLALQILHKLKTKYQHIEIILVIPYLNSNLDSSGYDETVYPPLENVPPRYAIIKRNQWMVETSDVLVAYVLHDWGGAYKTLCHAKCKNKRIISYLNLQEI